MLRAGGDDAEAGGGVPDEAVHRHGCVERGDHGALGLAGGVRCLAAPSVGAPDGRPRLPGLQPLAQQRHQPPDAQLGGLLDDDVAAVAGRGSEGERERPGRPRGRPKPLQDAHPGGRRVRPDDLGEELVPRPVKTRTLPPDAEPQHGDHVPARLRPEGNDIPHPALGRGEETAQAGGRGHGRKDSGREGRRQRRCSLNVSNGTGAGRGVRSRRISRTRTTNNEQRRYPPPLLTVPAASLQYSLLSRPCSPLSGAGEVLWRIRTRAAGASRSSASMSRTP